MSSLITVAKRYPRVLVLVGDALLCCKIDDLELCSYKWLKKARQRHVVRAIPSHADAPRVQSW